MLTVVAAVLIGGTAYTGGEGGVLGTVIGVFFLGVVQNGLTLSSVSSFWQGTVSGVILIVAVGLGVLREHGWSLRRRRAASREAPKDVQPADVEPALVRVDADNAQLRSELEAARLRLSDLERALARREGGGEVSRDP